tara:strand:+ start:293 stop:1054 length:762 start_codon:yes stop_codon:yes gene_type:complete
MKLYMLTSNKYTKKICPINIHFLNKYWPGLDITIVGYEDVLELKNLPSNVNVVSVGYQFKFGKIWSSGLIPFFKKISDEYFILIFDDHILLNEVDKNKIKILEEQFKLKKADKAMIGGGLPLSKTTKINNDLLLYNQGIDYRTSLHPAIWTKKYFLHYLRPGMTSWDFELVNNKEARFDKARIINLAYDYVDDSTGLQPKEQHTYSMLELYTKGKININDSGEVITNQPSSCFFNKKDLQYIWDNIHNKENNI